MKIQIEKFFPTAISRSSRQMMLVALTVAIFWTAGCSDNQKRRAAQDFVKQGSAICTDLTAQYKELDQQSQKANELFIWQVTHGNHPVLEQALSFVDPEEIQNGPLLVSMLKNPSDPALRLIRQHLPTARAILDDADPTSPMAPRGLPQALAQDLTRLVQTDVLYQSQEVLDFTAQKQKDAEKKRDDLQNKVDDLKEQLLKASPQQKEVLQPQLTEALMNLAPETDRAARYEVANEEVIEALYNEFEPTGTTNQPTPDTGEPGNASGVNQARKQFLAELHSRNQQQKRSGAFPAIRSNLPSPVKERVNRLLLANLLRDGIETTRYEESRLQEAAMDQRAELAQALADVFAAASDLINYDARGKTIIAAEAVQKQIEEVNHHPLNLGHGIPSNIFTRAFGDLARHVQVQEFYKDLPRINRAVKDIANLYASESDDYFLIAKDYYVQSYNTATSLLDTGKDIDALSALQPELDPYTFHLVTHPTDTPQGISHAKAQAYTFRQSHIQAVSRSVSAMQRKLQALAKTGNELVYGSPKQQRAMAAQVTSLGNQQP